MVLNASQEIPERFDPPTRRRIELQRQKQIRSLLAVRRTLISGQGERAPAKAKPADVVQA